MSVQIEFLVGIFTLIIRNIVKGFEIYRICEIHVPVLPFFVWLVTLQYVYRIRPEWHL